MPSLNLQFLSTLKDDYSKYPIFVETGTYYGETTFAMEPFFKNLYTIEISPQLYNISKYRYNSSSLQRNKINFLLGDSSHELEKLCPLLNNKTIFFLDGHWSCENAGKGDKDCPLIEKVTHINNLFKFEGIIIIDDVRLFGKGPKTNDEFVDWNDISESKIINILKDRITQFYFLPSSMHEKDRMIIHISNL